MNRKVEEYVHSRLKTLERERQTLAIMKENYTKHIKRELEMLIYAHRLDGTVRSANLTGTLTVIENPELQRIKTDNDERLPYVVAMMKDEDIRFSFLPAKGETDLLKYFQEKVLPFVKAI